jgi:hypothetical protein
MSALWILPYPQPWNSCCARCSVLVFWDVKFNFLLFLRFRCCVANALPRPLFQCRSSSIRFFFLCGVLLFISIPPPHFLCYVMFSSLKL